MSRFSRLLCGLLVVAGMTGPASAVVDVIQFDTTLFVFGTDQNDSVRISSDLVGRVRVIDDTATEGLYFGITDVLCSMGQGDDDVQVDTRNGFNQGLNVFVGTGFGNDSVTLDTTNSGNNITVSTGFGADSVVVNMFSSNSFGGATSISTGPGADDVQLTAFDESLDINLGFGNDSVSGIALDCLGTIDGRFGTDSCSGLEFSGGTLQVINCEN